MTWHAEYEAITHQWGETVGLKFGLESVAVAYANNLSASGMTQAVKALDAAGDDPAAMQKALDAYCDKLKDTLGKIDGAVDKQKSDKTLARKGLAQLRLKLDKFEEKYRAAMAPPPDLHAAARARADGAFAEMQARAKAEHDAEVEREGNAAEQFQAKLAARRALVAGLGKLLADLRSIATDIDRLHQSVPLLRARPADQIKHVVDVLHAQPAKLEAIGRAANDLLREPAWNANTRHSPSASEDHAQNALLTTITDTAKEIRDGRAAALAKLEQTLAQLA